MKWTKNGKIAERLIYWAIWLMIFFLPLIFWDFSDLGQRHRIVMGWIRSFPFLIVFILHNYILFPRLLLNHRRIIYFISAIILVLIINYFFIYNSALHHWFFNSFGVQPPQLGTEGAHHGPMPEINPEHPLHGQGPWEEGKTTTWHMQSYIVYSYNIIISFLILAFNASLKITSKWINDEQKRKELEKKTYSQNYLSCNIR